LKIGYWLLPLAFLGMAVGLKQESNKQFEISKNLEIFANLYKELNTYYVDDLDPGSLMRNGMESMVGSLDPFTNYIAESDIEGYRLRSSGKYFGIGAQSKKMNDYVTITKLYKDQPADKAGLKVGDQILSVDGKDAKGKTSAELDFVLQGFPDTDVLITVKRPGVANPVDINLTRGEVRRQNVPYSGMIGDDDIIYVALSTFTRNAGKNVANALRDLRIENPDAKGVVLDLRGNGGGLLLEAVNLSNVFIPKGELVVTTKGKVKEWDNAFRTLSSVTEGEMPVAVLIDKNSASASEIVSGVIQDYDRGVLVGQRSYGKGLVQNTKQIGYNSQLKMTTAKYYIPSGRCIQSVEYENGEPVNIPDSERTEFKTKNGRTVLDGGGVAPDLKIEAKADLPVIKSLQKANIVFDFITEYYAGKTDVAPVDELRFNDFDAFLAFLDKKQYTFKTDSQKLLDKMVKEATDEGYDLGNTVAQLEKKIKAEQRKIVLDNMDVIADLIEKEVAGRYYYEEGRVRIGLRNDKEVEEAIKLLKDTRRYEKMLKGKK
ncbi:MAG: S41 family peptidase, partial [Bacteroidota bacterium]